MNNILEDIINIASKISGVKEESLTRDTMIASDLRLDGDDVWELLDEVNNKYPLNFNGFVFEDHFTDESKINSIRDLLRNIFFKNTKKNFHEFTLGDIESWIKRGYWKEV